MTWLLVAVLSTLPAIRAESVPEVTVERAVVEDGTLRVDLRVPVPAPDDLVADDFRVISGDTYIVASSARRWLDETGPFTLVALVDESVPETASTRTILANLGRAGTTLELLPYSPGTLIPVFTRALELASKPGEAHLLVLGSATDADLPAELLARAAAAKIAVSYRPTAQAAAFVDELRARWTVEWPAAALRDGYTLSVRSVRSAPQPYTTPPPTLPPDPPPRPRRKSPLVAFAVIGGSLVLIGGIMVLAYRRRARAADAPPRRD